MGVPYTKPEAPFAGLICVVRVASYVTSLLDVPTTPATVMAKCTLSLYPDGITHRRTLLAIHAVDEHALVERGFAIRADAVGSEVLKCKPISVIEAPPDAGELYVVIALMIGASKLKPPFVGDVELPSVTPSPELSFRYTFGAWPGCVPRR
jgi:hypothetical protein